MLRDLWRKFRAQVVIEVPDSLFACLDCDSNECTESKFHDCPNRLDIAARLAAVRGTQTQNQGANVTPGAAPDPPAATEPASR